MGIRVHKIIGYGLSNIKCRKYQIVDSRFDCDRFSIVSGESRSVLTLPKFLKWLSSNRAKLITALNSEGWLFNTKRHIDEERFFKSMFSRTKLEFPSLYKVVTYDNEFGLRNVMVFSPFTARDWYRYDDIIDWIEETEKYRQRPRMYEFKRRTGIFPHEGLVIRIRKPNSTVANDLQKFGNIGGDSSLCKVDEDGIPMSLDGGFYNQLVGRWDAKLKPHVSGNTLTHLCNDWRPQLPVEIVWLLSYLDDRGCFKNVEKIKQDLRPMLYVYWS